MSSQDTGKEPDPHLSVLRLLTSPLRLICATVWRVVQEKDVLNYGVVEEFIASVAEAIPDLLSERQWVQLLLGLRAKMVLESCRFENSADPKTTQDYLDRMQLPTPPSIRSSDMDASQSSFRELLNILLNDADWKDVFFQEVFPEYGPKIDLQLQRLISTFVSRLEELLPTSRIEKVAAMLAEVPSVMEECFQTLSHPHKLLSSISHLKSHADIDSSEDHIYGRLPPAEPPEDDDCIFSFLSRPPLVQVVASGEEIKAGLSSSLFQDVLIECEEVSDLANDVYIVEAKFETKMREDMVKMGGHQDGGVNRHIDQQQELVRGNTTIPVPRQLIVKLDRIDITGIPLPPPLPTQSGRPRTKRLSFLRAKNIWQKIAPVDDDESDPDFTSDLVAQHSDAFAKRGITEGCKPPPVLFACSRCSFQANTGIALDQHLVKDHPNDFQQLHSARNHHISLSELQPNHKSFASVQQAVPERRGVLKTCTFCQLCFSHGDQMRKHLKEQHAVEIKPPHRPQSNVNYPRKLVSKTCRIPGQVSKTCPVCSKTFTRGTVMREHLKKQHSVISKEILPPRPTQDNLSVDNNTAGTASHNDQVNRELESIPEQTSIPGLVSKTCPVCNKTFTRGNVMRLHLKKQHSVISKEILSPQPNRDNLSGSEILPPRPTQDNSSVDNNMAGTASHNDQVNRELESIPKQRSIPGRVSKTCPVCNKTFTRGNVMRLHLKKQHSVISKEILSPQPNRDNLSGSEILPPRPTQDNSSVDNNMTGTASHNDQVNRELESSPEQTSIPGLVSKTCPVCNKTFTRGNVMREHLKKQHSVISKEILSDTQGMMTDVLAPKWILKCDGCKEHFSTPSNMRRHLREHSACSSVKFKPRRREVVPITCPVCEMTFKMDHALTRHLKTWHSEVCDKVLSSLSIQDNLREVVNSKTCPKCKKTFPQVYIMRRHLEHKHFVVCERILSPLSNQDSLPVENDAQGPIVASTAELLSNPAACGSVQQLQPSGSDETEQMAVNLGRKDLIGKEMDKHPGDNFQHPKALELEYAKEHSTSGNTGIHQLNQNDPTVLHFECSKCGERFSVLSELEKHNQNACTELTAVIHEVVSPTDDTQGVMTDVVLAPKWILKCDGCKEVFHTVGEMEKHVICHWEGKPLRCSLCERYFKNGLSLNSHTEVPSKCTICGGTFTNLSSLSLHYLEAHNIKDSYPCSDCQKTFLNVCRLVLHLQDHTGEFPFQCTRCLKRFKRATCLARHRQMSSCNVNWRIMERKFLCHVCGKGFHMLSSLKVHETIHQSTRNFICSECGKCFKGTVNLKAHMRTHVDDAVRRHHSCSYCGKKFLHAAALVRHHRIHTGERPFPCAKCNKTFKSDTELQKHMRYHNNYRPFQCQVCRKRFTQTSCLKSHMRAHTGERPYACSVCDKRFALSFQRKRHMLIHTGEKPFVCEHCGKAYNQKNCLTLHLKKCPQIIL
ncbi:zinc finger protein Xfin-like isoform X2 [Engraulis encrasicolus]|uniref:zinc finger protein Xfin-like isoform X2 n=1 Tax=Engraulis encrasicolus TaxID=184585 RepID=UPI002FD24B5F